MVACKALRARKPALCGRFDSGVNSMVTSVGMKLVFRLREVGFALPVCDLIEIREDCLDQVDRSTADPDRFFLGDLPFRGEPLPVRDMAGRLELDGDGPFCNRILLVLAGQDGPWGVMADYIEGIYPDQEFESRDIIPFFLDSQGSPFRHLALWRDELLVVWETEKIADCWGKG